MKSLIQIFVLISIFALNSNAESPILSPQDQLTQKLWTTSFVQDGVPMEFAQKISTDRNSQSFAELTVKCKFSEAGVAEDLSVSVKAKVVLDSQNINYVESKYLKKDTADGKRHCTAALSVVKNRYFFLSPNDLVINDTQWTGSLPAVAKESSTTALQHRWSYTIETQLGPIFLILDLRKTNIMRADVTCEFPDGKVSTSVEASMEVTDQYIINRESRLSKVNSPSGRYFCGAVIPVRKLSYKLNPAGDQMEVSGDQFIPDGSIFMKIK